MLQVPPLLASLFVPEATSCVDQVAGTGTRVGLSWGPGDRSFGKQGKGKAQEYTPPDFHHVLGESQKPTRNFRNNQNDLRDVYYVV